ncbi:MAG: cell division protein FtsQ/DivIB [Syntrophaceticus sp.]|jgi:cell division protein FtsQ
MSSAKRRKKSMKKRDWRRLARFLRNMLLIVMGVLAVYYFTQSPFFALKNIEVSGNTKVTETEIINKSGLSTGINYFELDTELVEKRLHSIPLVEVVAVKKRPPDSVVVNIKERKPLARFCTQEGLLVIDGQGYCLEKCTTAVSYDLPIITGLKPDSQNPGEQVINSDNLRVVLAALEQDVQQNFSEVNIAEADNLIAYTRQGIPVFLGTTKKLSEKLDIAVSYLNLLVDVDGIEYIDIRSIQAPAVKCQDEITKGDNLFSLLEN